MLVDCSNISLSVIIVTFNCKKIFLITLLQFAQFQAHQLASHFVDTFGYNDNEFNDNEDGMQ